MTRLAKYSADLYRGLEAETGVATGMKQVGSISVALTGERHELSTQGDNPRIVETVPGWTHDITNTGPDELVVMLWANEVFDRTRPDTIACAV